MPNDSGLKGDFPEFSDTDDDQSDDATHNEPFDEDYGDGEDINANEDIADDHNDDDDGSDFVPSTDSSESVDEKSGSETEVNLASCEPPRNLLENIGESQGIIVPQTNNVLNKRKWDKYHFCMYCNKKYSKLARHLEDVHGEEMEVSRVAALKPDRQKDNKDAIRKKEEERKRLFSIVRKRGDFNHNCQVLKDGKGTFIPEWRPSKPVAHTEYLFCEFCLGAYHKRKLKKHMVRCTEKPDGLKIGRNVQSLASMFLYTPDCASDALKLILDKMLVDDVSRCVKSDPTIIKYGNKMCSKLRLEGDQQHHISNKMRELARLVLEARKGCSSIASLKDCLQPKNFEFVIEAATELAGWNDEEGYMEVPSIGIKLGYSLKKCVAIVKSEGIINNLKSLKIQCDDFKELLAYSWNDEINRAARTTLDKRKWNKPKLLPLTSDIQKLVGHFKETIASSIIALGNNCSDVKAYQDLSSAILCSIILFNRRRSGEPARMKINAYKAVIDKKTVLNDEVSY